MRLSFLHFVLFFDETSSLFVGKLGVRPASIRVATLAETRLSLKRVVNEFIVNHVCILARVDTFKMEVLRRCLRLF